MICTLTTVGLSKGALSLVAGLGIPHPFGKFGGSLTEYFRIREEQARKVLDLLRIEVHGPNFVE